MSRPLSFQQLPFSAHPGESNLSPPPFPPPSPYLGVNPLVTLSTGGWGGVWVEGGRRDIKEGGERGKGGDLRVVLTPHLHFPLLTRAGIFLMSREAPHWLRVSLASFGKGGKW